MQWLKATGARVGFRVQGRALLTSSTRNFVFRGTYHVNAGCCALHPVQRRPHEIFNYTQSARGMQFLPL